jgi:hypothetical protein
LKQSLIYESQVNHLKEGRDAFKYERLPHLFNSSCDIFEPVIEVKFDTLLNIGWFYRREIQDVEDVLNVIGVQVWVAFISNSLYISFKYCFLSKSLNLISNLCLKDSAFLDDKACMV